MNVAAEHDFFELDDSVEGHEGDDDDEWIPPSANSSKQTAPKNSRRRTSGTTKTSRLSGKGRVSKLEEEMNDLTLQDGNAADDSVIIIPAKNRSGKKSIDKVEADEDSEDMKPAGPKKKKR